MVILDILSKDVAAMYWVASRICVLGVLDTKLHDIWPEVQLGCCEARQASTLARGAFVSNAKPAVFGTLLLCQPFWQAAAIVLRTKAAGVCLLEDKRVILWSLKTVSLLDLPLGHMVRGVSSDTFP